MTGKRQFSRITFAVEGSVRFSDSTYNCRLENLSLGGALVTLKDVGVSEMRAGDICELRLSRDNGEQQIRVTSRVAHHVFAFVGLAFLKLESETRAMLETIIDREKHKTACVDDTSTCRPPHFLQ